MITQENTPVETAQEQPAPDANEDMDVENNPEPEAIEDQAPSGKEEDGEDSADSSDGQEFPKKAVNALNRKNKTITKLRAQLRDLEAKLQQEPESVERKKVVPEEFETYGEYLKAEMKAELEEQLNKANSDNQKQQVEQQRQALLQQRDAEIAAQTEEVARYIPDLKQTIAPHIQTLDALPDAIAEIFYSLDNAPVAAYQLAKEGKLEGLQYANPHVAAYEIVAAQNRGLDALGRTNGQSRQVSQAPQPMKAARGTGSIKKPLSSNDNVLESLGLK